MESLNSPTKTRNLAGTGVAHVGASCFEGAFVLGLLQKEREEDTPPFRGMTHLVLGNGALL